MDLKINVCEDLKLPIVITKHLLSPTESNNESSESGISSVDSDDLKKFLFSPTKDDYVESDDGTEEKKFQNDFTLQLYNGQNQSKESSNQQIFYECRDILDLTYLKNSKEIVQFTVLPDNNVTCFFQNRAQYWRLQNEQEKENFKKCHCCEFTYPSSIQNQSHEKGANNKNAITDSLLAFLKSTDAESIPNMDIQTPSIFSKRLNNIVNLGRQSQSQQYQPTHGFCNSSNLYNHNQPVNQFMNSGTTLALFNLMNSASRNATRAFQVLSNNRPHYYNNVNNNFGLYKQF